MKAIDGVKVHLKQGYRQSGLEEGGYKFDAGMWPGSEDAKDKLVIHYLT